MKKTVSLLAVCLSLLVSASAATAQNQYQQQVMLQLEAAASTLLDAGYEPLVWEGSALNDGENELFVVSLRQGYTYALIGVCDVDCTDLDLYLYDDNGNHIVEDTEVDDTPVIEFTVLESSDFTLDVTMFECSEEPCYYGVALFGW